MKEKKQEYCPCGEPKLGPSKYCNRCKCLRMTKAGRKRLDEKYN